MRPPCCPPLKGPPPVDPRTAHWRKAWDADPEGKSWFQRVPATSLAMIAATGIGPSRPVIDIGGGASMLVDALLEAGHGDVTVLDIAAEGLAYSRARLGERADDVRWVEADITRWRPGRRYAIWHDRAAFHFLTDAEARRAYAEALRTGLAADGQAIIATFALDGPEKCSGLPVQRHDAASLVEALGGGYRVLETATEGHTTPSGGTQRFFWCRLGRMS